MTSRLRFDYRMCVAPAFGKPWKTRRPATSKWRISVLLTALAISRCLAYRFFNQNNTELAALFGVKTPTGRTNDLTAEGEIFDAEFQPGSGSGGPLLGLGWTP